MYGNTLKNSFECEKKRDKECIIYTSAGDDEITHGTLSKNIEVMDFMENNDKDKLFVIKKGIDLYLGNDDGYNIKVSKGGGGARITLQYGKSVDGEWVIFEERLVDLPNHSYGEVWGWVEIVTGRYRDTEEGKELSEKKWKKKQKENPIQIQ